MKHDISIDCAIVPKPFSPMYKMHKYWGRKPNNIIGEYIKTYCPEGEIVLDPFCGSGPVPIEATRHGIKSVAFDLNPMAIFITEMTLRYVNLRNFALTFKTVEKEISGIINELFKTTCPKCGATAIAEYTIWSRKKYDPLSDLKPIAILCLCQCETKAIYKAIEQRDLEYIKEVSDRSIPFWYPKDVKMPSHIRSDVRYIHELFTHRNLIALSIIYEAISNIDDPDIREIFKFIFTASLAQSSKLNMVDTRQGRQVSKGWIASSYSILRSHMEGNPWLNFSKRFRTVFKGKKESSAELWRYSKVSTFDDLLNSTGMTLLDVRSAIDLSGVPNDSIGYIFTDPPWGKTIPYFDLSFLWSSWLGYNLDWQEEIIQSRTRQQDENAYYHKLNRAFSEMYCKLKPDRRMTVTLPTIELSEWENVARSILDVGFQLERNIYQSQAYSIGESFRQRQIPTVLAGKAFLGDFYLTFKKPPKVYKRSVSVNKELVEQKVISIATSVLAKRGQPTPFLYLLLPIYEKLSREEVVSEAPDFIERILTAHIGKEFEVGYGDEKK